jgi:single-stranded-DNA-specific exonuclease
MAILAPDPAACAPRWVDRATGVGAPPATLSAACGGNEVLAAILQARGLTVEHAATLLAEPAAALTDPFLLPDMDRAVACLRAAAATGQRCGIVGDFDCDGLTGTTLLAEGLATLGLAVQTLLPHRLRDGYGLAPQHVEQLAADGCRLLLTVDCGATAHAGLRRAAQLGVTVLVTDHHPMRGPRPPCAALLNPRRAESRYPERELCGVGVAYQLLRALAQTGAAIDPEAGLDLVALGTIADVVPLCGENRTLVRRGLPRLTQAARPGLRALIAVSGLMRHTLSAHHVAFDLAPRLNAAGRLGDASPALALLLARRPRQARPLAEALDALNDQRRALTRATTSEAIAQIEAAGGPGPAIVVWAAHWHAGVVGLVAARLVERYGRPALVLGQLEGRWRGSARSVTDFDIAAALACCEDLLLRHGGHPLAAGLEAADERCLVALRGRLEALAARALGPAGQPQCLLIDLHLAAEAVDWRLAEAAAAMEPCGAGWPAPVVAVHGATVLEVGTDGGGLRLRVAGGGAMALTARARPGVLVPPDVQPGVVLDLAVIPTIQERGGCRCLELEILDTRRSGMATADHLPQALVRA